VDYSMGGIITRLLPDSTRYYCEFVLPSDAKLDETCSKYSDCCIANRLSTQPTNSNQLNTQCSTLLAAALIWRDRVARTWLAYIPAGIAYVLRSHMQMCSLFVYMFPYELFNAKSNSCEWT